MAPYVPPHLRPEFLKRNKNLLPASCDKLAAINDSTVLSDIEDVTNKDNKLPKPGPDGPKSVPKRVRVVSEPIEIPAAICPHATSDIDCSEKRNIATSEKSQVSLESNTNVGSASALATEDSSIRSKAGLTNVETPATTITGSSAQANPLQVKPVLVDHEDIKLLAKTKHPIERLSTTVIKPLVVPDLDDGWNVAVPGEQGKEKNKKKSSVIWHSSVANESDKKSQGNIVTKKNGWPKVRNVKKTASSTTPDEGGDSDNGGWGVQHNGYDPNSAAALMDWAGNWLPAPPHWESRRSFTNQNFFTDTETWIEHTEKAQGTIVSFNSSEIIIQKPTLDIENNAFTGSSSTDGTFAALSDVVPKTWLPDQIEGQSMQTFWLSLIQSDAPLTIEESEKPSTKPDWQPYWTRYIDDDLPYIKRLEVPDYHLDPDDEFYEVAQTDHGSNLKCTAKMEQKQHAKNYMKRARKAEFCHQQNQNYRARQLQNPHRPKVNIYLRIAKFSDFPQITDIYNWYVTNTVYTPERSKRSIDMMAARCTTSTEEKLYWVVAVIKSNSGGKSARHRNSAAMHFQQETIVGFGYPDDYFGMDSAYGYTATLELYVHPDYLHMGVGKNLMDRLVFLLDPGHKTYDAVKWRVSEPEHKMPGGIRIIENVIMNVSYVHGAEDQRMKWMESWLKGFGFEKVGKLDKVGIKYSKWVSIAIFQKRTDSGIDPKHMV